MIITKTGEIIPPVFLIKKNWICIQLCLENLYLIQGMSLVFLTLLMVGKIVTNNTIWNA